MTPEEAWWHHWNELQWLNDFEVEERYVAQDSEAASILHALCSAPHLGDGAFYPCKQSDIDTVRILPDPQPPFGKVSQRRALQELAAFNDFDRRPGRSMQRSIRNLDEYLFNRSRLRSGEIPSLVYKAFRDLDKVLFDGYLFDRVRLAWAGARQIENISRGRGQGLMGFSIPRRDRNGGFIFLCIDKLLFGMGSRPYEDDWDNVLTTLIHEMLHNYVYIRSYEEPRTGGGHPECWWEALEAIGRYVSEMFGFDALERHAEDGDVDEWD